MIKPILACENPYKTAELFSDAGWNIDFSQSPESGDPLVGVSLCDNSVLLGVTQNYVSDAQLEYLGSGVVMYITVPSDKIERIYERHHFLKPSELTVQPWGDTAFEVSIGDYKFMIAAQSRETL